MPCGACSDVNIWIDASSGDPDLYALDTSWPIVSSPPKCDNCQSFCQSIQSVLGQRDECLHLSTTEDQIYVVVYAFADYGAATITFENVGDVESGMAIEVVHAFINTKQPLSVLWL